MIYVTYLKAIRRTPNAIVTVVTATSPSGITDTAKLFIKTNMSVLFIYLLINISKYPKWS